jgi:hypothetical protein
MLSQYNPKIKLEKNSLYVKGSRTSLAWCFWGGGTWVKHAYQNECFVWRYDRLQNISYVFNVLLTVK